MEMYQLCIDLEGFVAMIRTLTAEAGREVGSETEHLPKVSNTWVPSLKN